MARAVQALREARAEVKARAAKAEARAMCSVLEGLRLCFPPSIKAVRRPPIVLSNTIKSIVVERLKPLV